MCCISLSCLFNIFSPFYPLWLVFLKSTGHTFCRTGSSFPCMISWSLSSECCSVLFSVSTRKHIMLVYSMTKNSTFYHKVAAQISSLWNHYHSFFKLIIDFVGHVLWFHTVSLAPIDSSCLKQLLLHQLLILIF